MSQDERYRVTLGVFAALFRYTTFTIAYQPAFLKVLLVKHAYDSKLWSLPGGGVDHKPPQHAPNRNRLFEEVMRETQEEIGVVPLLHPFLCRQYISLYADDCRIIYYGTISDATNPKIVDEKEIADIRWFNLLKLPDDLHYPQGVYLEEIAPFFHRFYSSSITCP